LQQAKDQITYYANTSIMHTFETKIKSEIKVNEFFIHAFHDSKGRTGDASRSQNAITATHKGPWVSELKRKVQHRPELNRNQKIETGYI